MGMGLGLELGFMLGSNVIAHAKMQYPPRFRELARPGFRVKVRIKNRVRVRAGVRV
jgi:hypothetical protein